MNREAPGAPPGAFPGAAPPAGPERLHGLFALATVAGISTLLCFEWEVNFTLDTLESAGHGDDWKYPVALRQGWTARVKGYFTRAGLTAQTYLRRAGDLTDDPLVVTFTGYSTPTAVGASVVFAGDGLITRANFSAPMAMATQEIEITGVGPATTGPTA